MKQSVPTSIRFNPSATAPMGSLGDGFDGKIPTESPRPEAPKQVSRPRKPTRSHLPKRPTVLLGSSLAPVLVVVALFWQTPGHAVRSSIAFGAVLVALTLLVALHTRFRRSLGTWRNYAAILIAIVFLATPERELLDRPLRMFYTSTIKLLLNSPKADQKKQPLSGLAMRRQA